MSKENLHVLMLEDNELDAELNQEQLNLLEEYNCAVKVIQDKQEYIAEISSQTPPDLILCDYNLPGFTGLDALKELNLRELLIPFIFVTGAMQEEVAADAIKAGAWDYVVKDRLFRLPLAVRSVLNLKRERNIAIEADKRTQRIVRGIDGTSVIVIVIDKDYCIDYVNQNFTKISGFLDEEVYRKSVFSVFENVDQGLLDSMRAILQKKEAYTGTYKIDDKRGSFFWEHLTITPIFDDNNQLNSYTIIADDISEQKKLEEDQKKSLNELKALNKELVLAKNQAEEGDKLKTAFLANLSHEIRTPMNGILGFTDLLKNEILSTDKVNLYIDILHQSGNRLINLINDLVDISKIQANQVTIQAQETYMGNLLDEIYSSFEAQAIEKDIEYTVEKELNGIDAIIIDKHKLEQIMNNLLNNAFKFTKKGTIKLQCSISGEQLFVKVTDTGVGISSNMKDIVFERFRQAENTYLKGVEGMGLGLYIAKSFAEKMGGEIRVESEINKGSEFVVKLPFVRAEQEERTHSKTNPGMEKTIHILVAEDDEINFLYLNEILSFQHFKVLHARDGNEAIRLYEEHPEISIILMDLKMPNLNGIDATREIRKKDTQVPILALTAYTSDTDKQNAIKAGCDDFIIKPVDKDKLMERIAFALNRINSDVKT